MSSLAFKAEQDWRVCMTVRVRALLLGSMGSQPGACREPVSLPLRLGVGLRWRSQPFPGQDAA